MNGKLAQNVRAKFFQDFEKSVSDDQPKQNEHNPAVEAMLCGFILEGDDIDFSPASTNVEQDWFYKL